MKRAPVPRKVPVWGTLVVVLGTACQSVTAPRYVEHIVLNPDSAILEVGESVHLDVRVLNPRGEHMPERVDRVGWSLSDEELATVELSIDGFRVTAMALGTVRLTVALGRGSGAANIHVQPSGLDRIEIRPAPVEVVLRESVAVEAVLLDSLGSALSPDGFRISWKVDDGSIARLTTADFAGIATGPTTGIRGIRVGSTRLKLVVGSLRVSTDIVVRPP